MITIDEVVDLCNRLLTQGQQHAREHQKAQEYIKKLEHELNENKLLVDRLRSRNQALSTANAAFTANATANTTADAALDRVRKPDNAILTEELEATRRATFNDSGSSDLSIIGRSSSRGYSGAAHDSAAQNPAQRAAQLSVDEAAKETTKSSRIREV